MIGNTTQDQMIGRLLERSDAMLRQSEEFSQALVSISHTMQSLERTVIKLETTVESIAEQAGNSRLLGERVFRNEAEIENLQRDLEPLIKLRDRIVAYAMGLGVLGVTAGSVFGGAVRKALGIAM